MFEPKLGMSYICSGITKNAIFVSGGPKVAVGNGLKHSLLGSYVYSE